MEDQLLWTKNREAIWRVKLLDQAYDIAMASCPDEMVPVLFLQIVREYYVHKWSRLGNQSLITDSDSMQQIINPEENEINQDRNLLKEEYDIPDEMFQVLQHQLAQCAIKVKQDLAGDIQAV